MSNLNDPNDPWNNEQAPFAGAETPAEVREATYEASATPETSDSYNTYAAQAAAAQATGAVPPPPPSGEMPNSAARPAGWVPVNGAANGAYYSAGSGYPPPAGAIPPSVPNPSLAFILGLIPGVGAMYNGQVAKGIVHLIVFAILVTIANNVNDIFGIFIAGWIFFQAFEAYHTAKARRDGLPLPNAFGWNDIGERVGLGKNWPFGPPTPAGAVPPTAASPFASPSGSPAAWTTAAPVPPGAPVTPYGGVAPNWAGGVATVQNVCNNYNF